MTALHRPLLLLVAVVLLSAATAQSPLDYNSIFPNKPAPPIKTRSEFLTELAAWTDLTIISTVINVFTATGVFPPEVAYDPPAVLFAPTNAAFIKFLAQLLPPTKKLEDEAFIRAAIMKLITLAANPNTPEMMIKTLARIVLYHRPAFPPFTAITESALKAQSPVKSSIDILINTSNYPAIVDAVGGTSTRYARQIATNSQSSFMIVDSVLTPFDLQPLRDLLLPPFNGSLAGSGLPTFSTDDLPPEAVAALQPLLGIPQGSLPGAPFAYPLSSYSNFLFGRTDLQIFRAVVTNIPELREALTSFNRTVHPLIPTDTAFINLVTGLKLPGVDGLVSSFQRNPFDPMLIQKVISLISGVTMALPSLPSLQDIIKYHVLVGPADLPSRSGPQATLLRDSLTLTSEESDIYVTDGDASRGDATVRSTFPTLTGYVSLIDQVLLPFNLGAALGIIDANGGVPKRTPDVNDPEASEAPISASAPEAFTVSPAPSASASGAAFGEGSTANQNSGDSGSCFPSDAMVVLADGSSVRMADLKAGDMIRTHPEKSSASQVFLFSHREKMTPTEVIRIETASGHVVRATKGHYLYVDGKLRAFAKVKVGDTVKTMNGDSKVIKVSKVVAIGLYAPHALESDLVVDGVWTSGYSTAVHPGWAEAALAPVRWAVKTFGWVEPLGDVLYGGADHLVGVLPRGAEVY